MLVVCGVITAISLGVAGQAARLAHAESARGPSQAERAAAAMVGVGQRWERLTLGRVFPAPVGYTSGQRTSETATRLGISAGDSCDEALDGTLDSAAQRFGCVAALRASYADELGGIVVTVGVVVFPDAGAAREFAAQVPSGEYPATGLQALDLPGTAAALFTNAARQASAIQVSGPYVVLAVAGYADGRPASQAAEQRPPVFGPVMNSIVSTVVAPLAAPEQVRCGDPEWTC
ncbi:MAG: hypothetical protein JWM19_537 [Actinomycetia bacterium]|nr:hypothetical protein [Actinomycetes bacterium]